jgi:DHA1 family tetracycline resistance protein-like MFS transporter
MRKLAPIYLTVLVDVLALTLILPLLPYYAQNLGATPLQVGLLIATFSAAQLVSAPVLGRLSDRHGRKPVLVGSQLGTLAGLVILGLADRIELLFLGRLIDGATAGNLTIAQAYITDATKPEERTKAFGFFGMAFGLGFLVGPAVSGVLAKRLGYHAPPLFAAGLSGLSVVLSSAFVPASPPRATGPHRGRFAGFLASPLVRVRLGEFFTFVASFAMLTGGLALFLERRLGYDVEEVGLVFALSGLVGGLAQGAIGRLAKRLGELTLSASGLVVMASGYVVLAFVDGPVSLAVAVGLGSLGSSVVRPALTTLLTQSVEESDRGVALGASQSAASLAQTLGPALSGWLIGRGWLSAWALGAGAAALAGLVVRALGTRKSA